MLMEILGITWHGGGEASSQSTAKRLFGARMRGIIPGGAVGPGTVGEGYNSGNFSEYTCR